MYQRTSDTLCGTNGESKRSFMSIKMLVFGLRLIRYSLLPETFSESKIHQNVFAAGASLQTPLWELTKLPTLSSRLGRGNPTFAPILATVLGQKYTFAPVFFWPPYLLYSLIIIWTAFNKFKHILINSYTNQYATPLYKHVRKRFPYISISLRCADVIVTSSKMPIFTLFGLKVFCKITITNANATNFW